MTKATPTSHRVRTSRAHVALLLLCALFTTGGSFTCKGSTHDDDGSVRAKVR